MTKSRISSKVTSASNRKHSHPPSNSICQEEADLSGVIFPEWSDYGLNSEKWDITQAKNTSPSPKDPSLSLDESLGYYDPHVFNLPPSLQVENWIRPHQMYPDVEILVYKQSNEYSDFLLHNMHIFNSEFVRSFVSSIGTLEYISKHSQWKIEGTNPNFEVNHENLSWKPWHHIYSMCKAGKNYPHDPVFNKQGKYIVRLFWMGCWRIVTIDDRIPIDKTNHALLPTLGVHSVIKTPVSPRKNNDRDSYLGKQSKNKKEKEKHTEENKSDQTAKQKLQFDKTQTTATIVKQVEIWPFLLCKALIKLASLTWSKGSELEEFNIIHSLTGWIVQNIDTKCFKSDDIWEMCAAYSENYKWPNDKVEEVHKSPKTSTKKQKASASSDKSSQRSSLKKDRASVLDSLNVPYYLMATIGDMRDAEESTIENLTPCWPHEFLVMQTRNIPLEKLPESVAHTWKRFRWIEWATRNGIHKEMDPSIKCLKILSAFKKCYKQVFHTVRNEKSMQIKTSTTTNRKKSDEEEHKLSFSGEIGLQSDNCPEDIFWCDFNKLSCYIHKITIYFRPSTFTTNLHISDINMKDNNNTKGQDAATRYLFWPNELLKSRNEPLYIYLNNLGYKCLIFVLSSSAGKNRLEGKEENVSSCELVIEKFDWMKTAINSRSFCLTAKGTTSTLVVLKPGKSVFRLWITSSDQFHLQILSETVVSAGNEEEILDNMAQESLLLTEMCNKVADSFGNLINAFGSQKYIESVRDFYSSYLPDNGAKKSDLSLLHEGFLKELTLILRETFSDALLKSSLLAIRVLLLTLSPSVSIQYSQDTFVVTSASLIDSNYSEEILLYEQSSVKIQKYFRRWRTKMLLSMHSVNHPNFLRIFDALRNIYKEIFSVDTRMQYLPRIIRNLVFPTDSINNTWKNSSLQNDLEMVLHLQDFMGDIKCTENSWTMLCRYEFNIASAKEECVKFSLYSNAYYYFLRVFNNKTNKEVATVANNGTVAYYSKCSEDYTVLAYGWTGMEETTFWKLRVVTVKSNFDSPVVVKETTIKGNFLCDYYLPNSQNLICRLQVGIRKSTSISVRLVCSLDSVKVKLRCTHGDVFVYNEIVGTGSVLLPFTKLQVFKENNRITYLPSKTSFVHGKSRMSFKKKRDKTESVCVSPYTTNSLMPSISVGPDNEPLKNFYLVEAYVLDDSWPLTQEEWSTVEDVRKIHDCVLPISVLSSSALETNRALQKFQTDTLLMSKPYWYIQIFGNDKHLGECNIDRRGREKIERIKAEWTNDFQRHQESHELRDNYLTKLHSDSSQFFLPGKKPMYKETRSSTKIAPNGQTLKPINFENYILDRNYDSSFSVESIMKCYGRVKSEKDVENDNKKIEASISRFNSKYEEYRAGAANMLEQDVTRNRQFDLWAHAATNDNVNRMISAYECRNVFVQSLVSNDKKKKTK